MSLRSMSGGGSLVTFSNTAQASERTMLPISRDRFFRHCSTAGAPERRARPLGQTVFCMSGLDDVGSVLCREEALGQRQSLSG